MLFHDAEAVANATPWEALIGALADTLADGTTATPDRQVYELAQTDGSTGSLLIMPSWIDNEAVGVKVVTYFPVNGGRDTSTVNAAYLLFDGTDGRPQAVIEGDALTVRRTAAVSALAGRHLARGDATTVLVLGTGQLAPILAEAHAAGRRLDSIEVWGRDIAAAHRVAASLRSVGLPAVPSADLERSVRQADIVSCATGATSPLVHGEWLKPGAHLDLVGGFRPDMRESDDVAITRSTVFVDTKVGAVSSGDLAQPLASGVLGETDIAAELADLVTGRHRGRDSNEQITLFKSAGFAAADLAAARLVVGQSQRGAELPIMRSVEENDGAS